LQNIKKFYFQRFSF